jgi:hypothetical protein
LLREAVKRLRHQLIILLLQAAALAERLLLTLTSLVAAVPEVILQEQCL